MKEYVEGWLIVDGALGEEDNFSTWEEFDAWATKTFQGCLDDGLDAQIYCIEHPHSQDVEECQCVQYLTDHHPYLSAEGGDAG